MDSKLYILFGVLIGILISAFLFIVFVDLEEQKIIYVEKNQLEMEKEVPVVATSPYGEGKMGKVNLRAVEGESRSLVETNPFLETDLQHSTYVASEVAEEVADVEVINTDFIFNFEIDSHVVGGSSAGAAATVAVIAALENKTVRDNAVITGTIREDGSIGRVSDILPKARVVADEGYDKFLIPQSQSTMVYYERIGEKRAGDYEFLGKILRPVKIDLKEELKEWDIELIEVSHIEEVKEYMLE